MGWWHPTVFCRAVAAKLPTCAAAQSLVGGWWLGWWHPTVFCRAVAAKLPTCATTPIGDIGAHILSIASLLGNIKLLTLVILFW